MDCGEGPRRGTPTSLGPTCLYLIFWEGSSKDIGVSVLGAEWPRQQKSQARGVAEPTGFSWCRAPGFEAEWPRQQKVQSRGVAEPTGFSGAAPQESRWEWICIVVFVACLARSLPKQHMGFV